MSKILFSMFSANYLLIYSLFTDYDKYKLKAICNIIFSQLKFEAKNILPSN